LKNGGGRLPTSFLLYFYLSTLFSYFIRYDKVDINNYMAQQFTKIGNNDKI